MTNNDIVGGNAGSLMLTRLGEIVGLVFDANLYSLGGRLWSDANLNRAIALHPAAIFEVLKNICGATCLSQELTAR